MKRSDAVKQLKHWLFGATNNPDHQKEAESLLRKIESMGMKPPTYTKTRMVTYTNDDGEEIEVPFKQSQNMWETE